MTLQSRKKPKIYFAGSISCGRADASEYAELIAILRRYGKVHERDIAQLSDSEIVVAEVSAISDAARHEIGRLIGQNSIGSRKGDDIYRAREIKPILILYRSSVRSNVTPMLRGISTLLGLSVVEYETIHEARIAIREFFKKSGFYYG